MLGPGWVSRGSPPPPLRGSLSNSLVIPCPPPPHVPTGDTRFPLVFGLPTARRGVTCRK